MLHGFKAFEVSSAWKVLQSHYIRLATCLSIYFTNQLTLSQPIYTNLIMLSSFLDLSRALLPMPPRPVPRLCHFFSSPRLLPGRLEGHCGSNCPEILRTTALRGAVNSISKQCFLGRIRV
jgi:hypothetical protein